MKAYLDEKHEGLNYKYLKGRPIQEKMAKELHQKANVPEGPCGLKELKQFQDALPGYQIKVLAVYKHQIIFIKSSSVVLKHLKRSVSLNFRIITMAAIPLVVFLTNHIFVMIVTVVMSTKTEASTLAKENGVGRVSGMTV